MTTDEKRAALLAHEDTVQIPVCGRSYPWNLCRWAKRLAEAEGLAVGEQVEALADGGDLDAVERALSNIVLAGLLPFTDSADDARDVVDLLGTADLFGLTGTITRALGAGDGPEGKARPAEAG